MDLKHQSWRQRVRLCGWLSLLGLVASVILLMSIPVSQPSDANGGFQMQVVLGGNTRERSEASHALWLRHPTPILVTGDEGYIRNALLKLGVPAASIIHEQTARSTWENAARSIPLLEKRNVESAVLVTSWFHTVRAAGCFRKNRSRIQFGIESDRQPEIFGFEEWKLVTKERCKSLVYLLTHGVNPWRSGS